MSETLNFGPEWLRALSSGSAGGVQQFKLAEHRYGREEMLALFCKTEKIPPELAEFQSILRKECQSPLTLSPLSEEERVSGSSFVFNPVSLINLVTVNILLILPSFGILYNVLVLSRAMTHGFLRESNHSYVSTQSSRLLKFTICQHIGTVQFDPWKACQFCT